MLDGGPYSMYLCDSHHSPNFPVLVVVAFTKKEKKNRAASRANT